MTIIECGETFCTDWAETHVDRTNVCRLNVQYGNRICTLHIRIDKLASWLESIRREQTTFIQAMTDADSACSKVEEKVTGMSGQNPSQLPFWSR